MSSPFVKAKKALVERGYTVGKVEYWNGFVKRRIDLFGCIDAICMQHGYPLIALQVTDITSVSKRMAKSHAVALQWVSSGNRFQVIGYTPKSRKPPRIMEMRPSGEWESVE